MKNKEEKLREALNEYFGEDVGDVEGGTIEPNFTAHFTRSPSLVHPVKHIMIATVPHELAHEVKRKELVDQLNKELKEIDNNYSVVKGIASPDVTYIHYYARPYCELYPNGNINFHGVYDSVKQIAKIMKIISCFSCKLKRLKEEN